MAQKQLKSNVLKGYKLGAPSTGSRVSVSTGDCIRALPGMFDANARPWVRATK